jgi:hypothetical protein
MTAAAFNFFLDFDAQLPFARASYVLKAAQLAAAAPVVAPKAMNDDTPVAANENAAPVTAPFLRAPIAPKRTFANSRFIRPFKRTTVRGWTAARGFGRNLTHVFGARARRPVNRGVRMASTFLMANSIMRGGQRMAMPRVDVMALLRSRTQAARAREIMGILSRRFATAAMDYAPDGKFDFSSWAKVAQQRGMYHPELT